MNRRAQLIVLLVAVAIAIITALAIVSKRSVERFESENKESGENKKKPCAIYFTEMVTECDAGDLDKPIISYTRRQQELADAIGKNAVPSQKQADEQEELQKIVREIKRLDSNPCKMEFPGFVNGTPVAFGGIKANANRGDPSTWATCSQSSNGSDVDAIPYADIEKQSKVKFTELNGAKVATFGSFDLKDVQAMYCLLNSFQKPSATQSKNSKSLKVVVNAKLEIDDIELLVDNQSHQINEVSDADVIDAFQSLYSDGLTEKGGEETTEKTPVAKWASVQIRKRDVCNNVTSTIVGTLETKAMDAITIKRVPLKEEHLRGTVDTMKETIKTITQSLSDTQTTIDATVADQKLLMDQISVAKARAESVQVRLDYPNPDSIPAGLRASIRPDDGTNLSNAANAANVNVDKAKLLTDHQSTIKILEAKHSALLTDQKTRESFIASQHDKIAAINEHIKSANLAFAAGIRSAITQKRLTINNAELKFVSPDGAIHLTF